MNNTKGFTLIEVLIAFAILSVVLASLYSTFFLSHKAVDALDESLLKVHETRMTIGIMRREVDSLLYGLRNKHSSFKVEDRDEYGKQASRFTFTAFSHLAPGLSRITYYVEEREGMLTLMKHVESAYNLSSEGDVYSESKGVDVIDGVDAFIVEVKNGDEWVKIWDAGEAGRIPEEIRVTINVMIKEKRFSLHEVMKPKIGKAI